ncbi:MAG: ABC transporter permease subunit [bacterium]|nr:ABC transporter permease subunit [bacterium]MDT8365439.1 ABC transporter permease subunit [bacterium]
MNIAAIYRREMRSYFSTPLAYVFIVIFLMLAGIFTFYLGGFFARAQADLEPFFTWHPWLYLFLAPALGMRLWAEERKTGTFELLMTLPVSMGDAVLGKFLAAWSMMAISLALTFPIWITVNVLGNPDNGVIVAGYLGSLLMSGAYLAVSACVSSATRNQVIAFVVSVVLCFTFLLLGFPLILDLFKPLLPGAVISFMSTVGFLQHFDSIVRGVVDIRDLLYFTTFIGLWLYAGAWAVDHHRS